MKARAEKTAHIQEQPTEQQAHENDDDDDETIDKELERVQQNVTPEFRRGTKCISYVRQDQFTHI
jgi:hypothetical protein